MRSVGIVAGSMGVTVILGGVMLGTIAVCVLLVLWAPAPGDPGAIRQAVVDQSEQLGWCAEGTDGGELDLELVVRRGQAMHVGVRSANVDPEVAACIADTTLSLSLPRVTASAHLPLRLSTGSVAPR